MAVYVAGCRETTQTLVALYAGSSAATFSAMAAERILVAGAGAIGSVLGAALGAAGRDVTLLGRREHLDAIARGGLRLSGIFGERTVRGFKLATSTDQLDGRFALILLTVKSYDTHKMAAALGDRIAAGGLAVSMQNGIGNIEMFAARLGAHRVLGARVIFGAEIPAPGAAHVTVIAEPVAIGPAPALHRDDAPQLERRARDIAALLDCAGIPAVAVPDVMPVLWTKVLYNVALNPLGALLGLHYGALAEDQDLRPIMDAAIGEAFAVACAEHIALPFADADAYRRVFYDKLIPPTFDHRPSMLYDLKVRGRTEIGALNGKIVELALKHGIAAPANVMLMRMIRAAERARALRIAASPK
jgi:2-dehydropantoate 2-reductase